MKYNTIKEIKNYTQEERKSKKVFSALFGSNIVSMFLTPFDIVKTRAQAIKGYNSDINKIASLMYKIKKEEGISALWRGYHVCIISSIPSTAFYFLCYDFFKENYIKETNSKYSKVFLYGGLSRFIASTIVMPMELYRTRVQAHIGGGMNGDLHILKELWNITRKYGVSTLWKGYMPTIYREVPFSSIYWVNYELIYPHISNVCGNKRGSFLSGFIAGGITAYLTTPFDVIKTKIQTRDLSIRRSSYHVLKNILTTDGINGFFSGYQPRVVKTSIACGIMVYIYNFAKVDNE